MKEIEEEKESKKKKNIIQNCDIMFPIKWKRSLRRNEDEERIPCAGRRKARFPVE